MFPVSAFYNHTRAAPSIKWQPSFMYRPPRVTHKSLITCILFEADYFMMDTVVMYSIKIRQIMLMIRNDMQIIIAGLKYLVMIMLLRTRVRVVTVSSATDEGDVDANTFVEHRE